MTDQEQRKKALFDALDSAEKTLNKNQSKFPQNIDDFNNRSGRTERHQRSSIEKYKNRNSIFKKPSLPLRKCLPSRGRANHELNPEKYIKYSLEDVSDLSDRQNSAAAFSFLRSMEERKMASQDEEASSSKQTKIMFKSSTKLKDHDERKEEKRIKGSKFVMAEYVVGGEKKSKPKKKNIAIDKNPKLHLKLSHLEEDDE